MLLPLARIAFALAISTMLPLMLIACGGDGDGNTGIQQTPSAVASTPSTALPTTIPKDDLPKPVELAIEMAARDEDVNIDDIAVTGYSEEQWNDASLGCPEPGGVYAQVITDGYSVHLIVNGTEYEYHTDMGTAVVRCTP